MTRAMRQATVRQPLLVGMRAYRVLVTVPAWVLFGAATSFVLIHVGPDLPVPGATIIGRVGAALSLALVVSPLALLFAAGFLRDRLRRAIATRACDIEVGADEMRVQGGQAHGFAAALSGLGTPSSVQFSARELRVRRPDGVQLRVPVPPDADEQASLEALSSVLAATAQARGLGGAVPRHQPPDVMHCRGCGAALPLAPGRSVRCPYCQAETPLPAELVAKLTAAERLQRQHARDEALCRALLRQPSARVANVVAFGSGALVIALAVMAAMICGAFLLIDGKEAGLPPLGGLGLMLMGLALLPIAFVRRVLGSRRALRVLTLGFAAIPPEREGGLASCRSCGAPLPDVEPHVLLSRCGYCAAENLRVVDWRVHASIVERFAGAEPSPAAALAPLLRVRRRAAWLGVTGAGVIAIGCWWLSTAPKPPPADAATVFVPYVAARAPLAKERVRAFDPRVDVREEAAFPGRVAALVPGANGRVSALVRGAGSSRVIDAPQGEVTPDALRAAPEVPLAASYSRLSANEPLILAADGEVSCLRADGRKTALYGGERFSDPIIVDVAAGPGCTAYVTTRATDEGHLRLRWVDGSQAIHVRESARQAALSPNGRLLAVTFLGGGERFQLAVIPRDGSEPGRLVTQGTGHIAHPAWSPDGTRLAFLSESVRDSIQYGVRTGRVYLYLTNLRGKLVQLTAGGDLELIRPVWTERGIHVVARESALGREAVLLRVVPPP